MILTNYHPLSNFVIKRSLSLFHLNTALSQENIKVREHLIQSTKTDFDTIANSESNSHQLIKFNKLVMNYVQDKQMVEEP